MTATRSLLAATLIVFSVGVVHSEQPPPRPRMTEVLQQRLKDRPDDPTLYYYLAVYQAVEGNRAESIAALEQVLKLGRGFLPSRGIGFDAIWDDPGFQDVRNRIERTLPRVIEAREVFRLGNDLLPEGIAFDPVTRSTYIGSVAARKIVRVDSTGAMSDLSRPGELQHVLGLAVDPGRRRLYAVSTSTLTDSGRANPVNQIVGYDLESGKLDRSFNVAGATQLNDVIVAPGGDLYTTDSGAGAVYHVRAGGPVDTLMAPGTLPGANGLSLSPDGSGLYVAHGSGVARVDFGGAPLLARLELPPGETIAAIDGLYTDGNTLIGIQNVTNPGRVIRMRLRKDGKGVEKVETLLSHHHEAIDEPTTGAIAGRSFVFLATTQMARFTPKGTIESPETVKPAVVLGLDLDRAYE